MIKVFDKSNLEEALAKKPVLLFYSENGACGCSGLLFAIFNDNSCYAYSTYYQKSDGELIKEIIECIPEFRVLIGTSGLIKNKRERYDDLELIYLGLGNHALINENLYHYLNEIEGEYSYGKFIKLARSIVGDEFNSICSLVEEAING